MNSSWQEPRPGTPDVAKPTSVFSLGASRDGQYSNDYGSVGGTMRRISAGEFQARCLTVIREVQATGEPVVQVAPVDTENDDVFGFMAGQFKIVGDIES